MVASRELASAIRDHAASFVGSWGTPEAAATFVPLDEVIAAKHLEEADADYGDLILESDFDAQPTY